MEIPVRSPTPCHWYKMISSILESLEINLKCCPNEPCCFVGTPIPDRPPLYLVLYVDDFVYFSSDPDVERYFESAIQAKLSVEFMGTADWFLGTKFDWFTDESSGVVSCCLSQEAYANEVVTAMGLQHASVSPLMTPY